MKNLAKKLLLFILLFSLVIQLSSCNTATLSQDLNKMNIHYIDVGQGDSILICVNGKNMLIDSGPKSSEKNLTSYLHKLNISKLDYVIATHPHEDHIGNMANIINNYNIGAFYAPKKTSNTTAFSDMIKALQKKKLKINVPKPGTYLYLGSDVTCEIISPSNSYYEDINNYSIVVKISYENNKFLFMGDAQKSVEKEIINNGFDVNCDILKVGHHGSSTSSSKEFLDKVNPKIAVISCGKGNMYGHPHKETLAELKNRNIKVYRTDLDGTITFSSDGTNIKEVK